MGFVSPTFKIRCPFCRVTFHPGDCAIYSTATPGKLLRDRPMPNTAEYVRSRTWIEELKGPVYTLEMAVRQCPNCNLPLFEGIEECDNLNIAIIGDTSSGKTSYIAALIYQLKRSVLMQNGRGLTQLRPRNKSTSDKYQSIYYDPIIKDRIAVGTRPGRFDQQGKPIRDDPLIYQFEIQDHASTSKTMLNLLFYDLSGEDLADQDLLVQFGEHVLRADGIIYLADPLSMEYLRLQIPPEARNSTSVLTNRLPGEVLSTVISRLERYQGTSRGDRIHVPIAITISKADLLQYIIPENIRPKFWLMHRPAYDGRAHQEDIAGIDQEVRSILNRSGEQSLMQLGARFEAASFFAISATGTSPDSTGRYPSFEPHRCLDPFIWLLWKLRYLSAAR